MPGPRSFKQRLSGAASLRQLRVFKPPPAKFKPLEASKRQLTAYGLPLPPDPKTHPTQAKLWRMHLGDRTEWIQAELEIERKTVHFGGFHGDPSAGGVPPTDLPLLDRYSPIFTRPGEINPLLILLRDLSPQYSNNWSGAYAPQPSGEPFNNVYATFNVPAMQPPPSAWNGKGWNDGVYHCSTWVGLDGWNGPDVVQAGATSVATVTKGVISTRYYAWVEFWPALEAPVSNFPVSPGDMLAVTVCTPFSTTHGVAVLSNKSTGQSTTVGFDAPSGSVATGVVAEWIVENPGSTPPGVLGNYGSVVFHDCVAGSKTQERNLLSATPIDMVDGSGNVISTGWIDSASQLECSFGH
jgi:hypothetical protein